jgi:ketosteroid isomerase-like protein
MKKSIIFFLCGMSIILFTACNDAAKTEEPATTEALDAPKPATAEPAKPDMAQIRADIVAVETNWANAINAKDINALMALYADDAQSMQDGGPTLVGKAAIQKQQEVDFAGPRKFASIAFETTDVYAQGDVVTEIGKGIYKDAAGKTTGTGKYIAIFEKKDGKYLCIREIYNKDTK